MKLAAQENLVPGSAFAEQLANLHAYGYEGVELNGRELRSRLPEVKAPLGDSPVRASTICGGLPNAFTSPDPKLRQDSITAARDLLHCAAEVGARGIVFVPRFNRTEGVPDLSPLYSVDQLQRDLLVAVLRPLAQAAADLGVCLIMEPLNRYEARFPK